MKKFISTLIGIFIISLLQAQPTGWQVNSADFEYSMTITAAVEFDGVSYGAENDYLAAFIEGECRGVAKAAWVETYGTYMFFLTVFSSEYSGKQIDFKHYSAQNASILTGFYPQYFSNGKNLGTASDPFLISDEVPENQYQINFTVYDGTDPLQGAFISINNTVFTTDSEGKATMQLVDGNYDYTVRADGFEETVSTLTVSGEPGSKDIVMEEIKQQVAFLVTSGDSPVEEASININSKQLTTDADGIASIDLSTGNYNYTVSAVGYEEAAGSVDVGNADITKGVAINEITFAVNFTVNDGSIPLENAYVTIDDSTLVTDNNGEVTIELQGGTYEYTAIQEGFGLYSDILTVSGAPVDQVISLSSQKYTVSFEVSSDTGLVKDATININDDTLKTDAAGTASLDVLNGIYEYSVSKGDYGVVVDTVKVNGAAINVPSTLSSDVFTLKFRVSSDAGWVENAAISINDTTLMTDAEGMDSIQLLNGLYEYTITKQDYIDVTNSIQIQADREELVTLNIETFRLSFTVKNEASLLNGATININNNALTTNLAGKAAIDLQPGTYQYTVSKTGHVSNTNTVEIVDADISETIVLDPVTYNVNFSVSYNTLPVEDAAISIASNGLTTDSDGNASIELGQGSYNYMVSKAGYNDTVGIVTVTDADVQEDIALSAENYTVIFSVTHDTKPVEGTTVEVGGREAITDMNGIASFELINGTHPYTVTNDTLEDVTGTVEVVNSDFVKNVFLSNTKYDVTFSVIFDSSPFAGATVEIAGQEVVTANDGVASFALTQGTYQYSVTSDNLEDVTGTVEVINSNVAKNVFLSTVKYDVTFSVNFGSSPVEGASININDVSLSTNARGQANIKLENGAYNYTISKEGYSDETATITVDSASAVENVFLSEVTYPVTFAVTRDGEPVSGATIAVGGTYEHTDGEGKASFELQDGEYGYSCSADGYASVSDSITIAGVEALEVINLKLITSIDIEAPGEIRVFPNPAYDRINISSDERIESVKLINLNGQVMIQKEGNISELNVDHYNPGIYLLQLKTNDNEVHNVKLMIR